MGKRFEISRLALKAAGYLAAILLAGLLGNECARFNRDGFRRSSAFPTPKVETAESIGKRLKDLSMSLSGQDPAARTQALRELENFGVPAIPVLASLLREEGDREFLNRVMETLGRLSRKAQTDDAVPALEGVLYWKSNGSEKAAQDSGVIALCALMGIETEKSFRAIEKYQKDLETKALGDKDGSVRVQSVERLGFFGPSALPFIVSLIREGDMASAAAAVRTLGEMGFYADKAVPDLKKTLGWRNQSFPYEVFCALKKIGTPAALKAFQEWKRVAPVPALADDCMALSVYDGGPPRALGCLRGRWSVPDSMVEEWRRGQESEGQEGESSHE